MTAWSESSVPTALDRARPTWAYPVFLIAGFSFLHERCVDLKLGESSRAGPDRRGRVSGARFQHPLQQIAQCQSLLPRQPRQRLPCEVQ